ncbi:MULTISPECIES: hypothetical protein [Paenibacillus]|uniref:Uncharacterized protein n=1 Tax=Paenibacillus naphthalenovorans TaxID=162209 RepID=A0A0U2UEF7_9BACL|nr:MULTISPECIES: hypothetical protein [Paenibacillus]ALS24633.1 hypothetical protein IJ22_43470 [Paenibacillus naphthalenovorans]NTZ16124.1 hypothetical protein [Paenibacillus sp. JMULE4]
MAKAGSIVFHLNSSDLESKGKADRLMTFYRQLLKNRRLTRFCKEAFIEKAERQLNGQEEQYTLLNYYIKSKGIDYILDAVQEKEKRPSPAADETEMNKAVNHIIQAVLKGIQTELRRPAPPIPVNAQNPDPLSKPKPDLFKLKALL